MKFLIIGRTATGKDTLRQLLENKYNWTFVQSMTTRPKRSPDENTHIFITENEAKEISQSQKAAWTEINGYEYFATKEQIYDSDAYLIDPIGAEMLLDNMPDEYFEIIYLKAPDLALQQKMAINRAENKTEESKIFQSRYQSENEQFSKFEKDIENNTFNHSNCGRIHLFINNYNLKEMEEFVDTIEQDRRFHRNAVAVINDCITQNIINSKNGKPIIIQEGKETTINQDYLASLFLDHPNEIFGDFMLHWFSSRDVDMQDYITARDIDLNDFFNNVSPAVEKLTASDEQIENRNQKIQKAEETFKNLEKENTQENQKGE